MFIESYEVIPTYGDTLYFNANELYLLNKANFGNADISYLETQGYLQDGVTVQNWTSVPRVLQLQIFKPHLDSRTEYWEERKKLLGVFNPFAAPLTFRITRNDGSQRELRDIYPTNGLLFSNNDNDTSWSINETIALTAKNPIWYNPNTVTYNPSASVNENLVFPTEFGILFGSFGNAYTATFTYQGQWKAYPIITITGAYGTATLTNNFTNSEIKLTTEIGNNVQRIINLNPNNLSITDGDGNNKFHELSSNSNLVDFYIKPFIGESSISVSLTSPSVDSGVQIAFEETYLGI